MLNALPQGTSEGQKYACAPLPPYLDQLEEEMEETGEERRPLYDVCFHLLKLYSDRWVCEDELGDGGQVWGLVVYLVMFNHVCQT